MQAQNTSPFFPVDALPYQAYQLLQESKAAFALAHKNLATRAAEVFGTLPKLPDVKPLPPVAIDKMRQRLEELLSRDWQDAEAGVYPKQLLFEQAWQDFLAWYPAVWFDLPGTWERRRERRFQDFDTTIDTAGYPSYYLQNFHYQTDGYLSDRSAELYDLQVEILFNGAADPMRRRVLAPLKAGLQTAFAAVIPQQIRVLDVACGTGRTLLGLRAALPKASLHGTDLSPAYLRKATRLLSELPGELPQLLQANAEQLPYTDGYFHGLTCVFTFHELPAPARQATIEAAFRVLQPGGTFVICDSIQLGDSLEDLEPMMANFPVFFHEPYYRHYITDDMNARLEKAGFAVLETQTYLASKYWVARKPDA